MTNFEFDGRTCPDCGETPSMFINGRCRECHEDSCSFSLDGDVPPANFDPGYAGESWD